MLKVNSDEHLIRFLKNQKAHSFVPSILEKKLN